MSQRLPCSQCGALILPETAQKNAGLCMPCKGGYREQIEDGKRANEEQKQFYESAEYKYWSNLVERVHHSPEGFEGLTEQEKIFYAVSCLIGEVYNGGFYQFFSNSSGRLYGYALNGLHELGAETSASLLVQAKELLFEERPIPLDRVERFQLMPTEEAPEIEKRLDALDRIFYTEPDQVSEKCGAYAIKHQFYPSV
ncbi:MAG: DMP19 family protein [Pseudomonadales bacterium]|jgi:hypothetical protein|nr:DMP19 family protein [Pseudomonadales bacterium]